MGEPKTDKAHRLRETLEGEEEEGDVNSPEVEDSGDRDGRLPSLSGGGGALIFSSFTYVDLVICQLTVKSNIGQSSR